MPRQLLPFIVASLLLALTPGPDILTVIVRSITQGTRAGLIAAAGFASGLTVHTTLAAAGIAALLAASPDAMRAIRWFGTAYLLYLAFRIAASRDPIRLDAADNANRRTLSTIYRQSILMNILNPKVTLFFLGFLPAFVERGNPSAPAPWIQIITLGILFAICTLLCFGSAALFAGTISRWLRRKPAAADTLRWATAGLFLALALWIAFT